MDDAKLVALWQLGSHRNPLWRNYTPKDERKPRRKEGWREEKKGGRLADRGEGNKEYRETLPRGRSTVELFPFHITELEAAYSLERDSQPSMYLAEQLLRGEGRVEEAWSVRKHCTCMRIITAQREGKCTG